MVALKTFKNLPVERQEEIIAVCLEEFALHEYQAASLSTIVTNLNLAKGSFYRYFENKKTLYFFLLEYCIDKRIKSDAEYIKDPSAEIFDLMLEHLVAKMQFDKKFPLHSAFIYNVMQEKNSDELGNIQLTSKLKALDAIKPLIKASIKNKSIRKDLDPDTLAFMVFKIQFMILEYIEMTYKIDFRKNIRDKKPLYNFSEKEMIKTARIFVGVLKNGIANH